MKRRIALSAVLLFLAWTAVCALLARSDVARARDRLESLGGKDSTEAGAALDKAADDLRSARSKLNQPAPWLAARIPYLGRSLMALRVVDETALDVVEAADDVLQVVGDTPLVDEGKVDVRRLADLSAALRKAAEDTRDVPARLRGLRTGLTPPQVGDNVRKAQGQLGSVPGTLTKSADALDALGGVLGRDGPRRLLVVLENNAELRGTGGLVSVFAEATARDGEVTLGAFKDVVDVAESRAFVDTVPAPPDYVARYGRFLANTTLWRNANMSPDIPTSASVLAELAAKSLKRRPDAVILLDVRAIAAILGATGRAELADGRTLSEENAVEELLSKAYAGVPDTRAGQDERRRRLRAAADAVVGRIFDGDASAIGLASALGDAAGGRHVAVWSADAEEQAAFDAAGATGAVRPSADLVMTTLHNLGGGGGEGNKLDYYTRAEHSVRVRVSRGEAVTERTYRLRNTAPATGLPRYVAGIERPGESRSLVSFALPKGAVVEEFSRDGTGLEVRPTDEGSYAVLDDVASLDPGAATTWTLRYRIPLDAGYYDLRVVPQPMAYDAELTLDVKPDGNAFFRETTYEGAFDRERLVTVDTGDGTFWERMGRRFRRFWTEPLFD
ncbi:MAG TPA: DUF4012 domain-containing protein [Frankiaceae bacterium]|nr:DUF4012 domain-containing protein [Frankiaceae bacterium]